MRLPRLVLAAVIAAFGCSHTEPFPPADYGTDVPFQPGPPPRLTANLGDDGEISFTPDGANLVYSINRACIAFLPVHQARDSQWICPPPPDTIRDIYNLPALSATRRLAFVFTRFKASPSPAYEAVLIAQLPDIRDTAEVIPIPFRSVVDDAFHLEVTQLAWLRGDTLALLTDSIVYLTDPASTAFPREFIRLPLPGPVASIQSDRAGSVLFLRVRGDARVLAWDLATRQLSTIYDFGIDSIGRIAVGTRHLAAVTPGRVVRINLGDNSVTSVLTHGVLIRELAMTPDGSDIIGSGVDTTLNSPLPTSDLFRLGSRPD